MDPKMAPAGQGRDSPVTKDMKKGSSGSSKASQKKNQWKMLPKPKKIEKIAAYCPCKVSVPLHLLKIIYSRTYVIHRVLHSSGIRHRI